MFHTNPFRKLTPVRGDNVPTVSDFNHLLEALERITYQRGPLTSSDGAGLRSREISWSPILARITDIDRTPSLSVPTPSGAYSWVQVYSVEDGTTAENSWKLTGEITTYPAFELNGNLNVPIGSIVQLLPGDGNFFVFCSPSPSTSHTVWYTEYLHIENLQSSIQPGNVIAKDEYIGDIAIRVNPADFGGSAHLHWGLGDGINDFHPQDQFIDSNIGQTLDLVPYFEATYGIPTASDHLGAVSPPNPQHLSATQISLIKTRTQLPISLAEFPAAQMFQHSTEHSSYEYFCIDFASNLDPPNDTSAGEKVYNTILTDDVLTTVLFVEHIDNEIDPDGHRLGWIVILKHELLSEQVPEDIPLIGIWSRPDSPDFPEFQGYASHIQFHESYPLTRTGSILYVGPSGAGYNLTVEEADGNPSYTNIDTIIFDQDDGFEVSQPAPGQVQINLPPQLTISELDGSPIYSNINSIVLDQSDGFVLTQPSPGEVRIDMVHPANVLNVGELDGSPLYTNVDTLLFDQSDGFVVTNPAPGTVRIDLTGAGFNLTVMEEDTSPSYSNINTIIFDEDDGFILTQPGANQVHVALPNSQCWEALDDDIDANQNDYDPLGYKWIRFTRGSSPANVDITGFLAAPDDGCPLLITYTHLTGGGSGFPNTITLKVNSGSSSVGNKIIGPETSNNDLVLYSGMSVLLRYDLGDGVWRIVSIGVGPFRGATGSAAGTTGLVPIPASTDNVKFLRGDKTWAVPVNIEERAFGSPVVTRLDAIQFDTNESDDPFTTSTAYFWVRFNVNGNKLHLTRWGEDYVGSHLAAFPQGQGPGTVLAGTPVTLPANGGSIQIPITIQGYRFFGPGSLKYYCTSTSTAHDIEWRLYKRIRVAVGEEVTTTSNGTETFTSGGAAAIREAIGGNFTLLPGTYALVIRNKHATNAISIGTEATGTLAYNLIPTQKTLGSALADGLDLATGWTETAVDMPGVVIH